MTTTLEASTDADTVAGFTLADIRGIADLAERVTAASAVARETERLSDLSRSRRDVAALVMIAPYQAIQMPYETTIDRIQNDLAAGKITARVAQERKDRAQGIRRKNMEAVEHKPVDVYRVIGVSRGMFVRMMHRAPRELPQIDDAPKVAAAAAAECARYDAMNKEARAIRDEAIMALLNGDRATGRQPVSNADVARLSGLTTPRVAQLRYGTR
jgi:hypothetical protein